MVESQSSTVISIDLSMFQPAPNFTPRLNPLSIRLDYNNYVLWRSQVLSSVRAHGFESILDGTALILAPFVEMRIDLRSKDQTEISK